MGTEQQNESGNSGNDAAAHKKVWWYQQPAPIDRFTGWLVLWTALLFAANLAALFFIGQQWKVASDAQIDTREQLKAVVVFQIFNEVIANDKDGKPAAYTFIPQFFNSGGTRTAVFKPWGSIHYFDNTIPNNLDLSKPWDKIDVVNSVIGPNSVIQITPISISFADAEKIRRKEGTALIWGAAEYANIFEPSKIHTLSFCYRLEPITTIDGRNILQAVQYRPDCNTNS